MSGIDSTFITTLRDEFLAPWEYVPNDGSEPRIFAQDQWKEMPRLKPPAPQPLTIATLTGIRDYLKADVDLLEKGSFMLHVCLPDRVEIVDGLEQEAQHFRRCVYVRADAELPKFQFGDYLDAEMFIVGLATKFVATEERQRLLEFVASIRDEAVTTVVDDGVAQMVNTARGVKVAREKSPNPILLRPFRTFREVDQPELPFVFRLRPQEGDLPRIAMFEADGGAWKLEAITSVAEWLRREIPNVAVIG